MDKGDTKLGNLVETKKSLEEKLEKIEAEDETGERFKSEPAYYCNGCGWEININLQKRWHCTECDNFDFCQVCFENTCHEHYMYQDDYYPTDIIYSV